MSRSKRTAVFLSGIWVAAILAGAPASAQLSIDRFSGIPVDSGIGLGRVRLSGMGGFLAAVPDENNEITLNDFSRNPAGFGDDRDSWSIDVRYSHTEFVDGPNSLDGDDTKVNDGIFALAFHKPGKFGVGGAIDYIEASARDATRTREAYTIAGFNLVGSMYLFPKVIAGIDLGYSDESQDVSSSSIYTIDHNTTIPRAGLGVAVLPLTGVTLGARGTALPVTIEGASQSSRHDDSFTWDRPTTSWSVHGFVDRGRLEAGIDYSRRDVEGKESVRISWSERFIYNPTPETVTRETDTFSEDRTAEVLRARVQLDVIPRKLALSGAYADVSEDFSVVSNPNALGSLSKGSAEGSSSSWLLGASLTTFRGRLLIAGEFLGVSSDYNQVTALDGLKVERDDLILRAGGEYLIGEKVAVRAGLIRGNRDLTTSLASEPGGEYAPDPNNTGSYGSWRVAAGLGLIPWGAIWQIDFAYETTLDSDRGDELSNFGAYIRYLF